MDRVPLFIFHIRRAAVFGKTNFHLLLLESINNRHVMACSPNIPDFISLRAEGLIRIGFCPDVNNGGLAVEINNKMAQVIVIMAFTVVTGLGRKD